MSNYTPADVKLLLQLSNFYSNIFENKKTDAISSKKKEEIWL